MTVLLRLLRYFWEALVMLAALLAWTAVMYPLLVIVLLAGEEAGR